MSPVKCDHCSVYNPPENFVCSQCGAPLRHQPALYLNLGGLDLHLHYPLPEGIRISQLFGENPQWYTISKGHNGIDWACTVGTDVYAMQDGEVIRADATSGKTGYGRHIRVQHPEGISIYGHLSQMFINVGDRVAAGQRIGLSGGAITDPACGNSTGAHLHAEYRLANTPNPIPGGYIYNAVDLLPLLVSSDAWEVQGVDVSAWNGTMDWNITKNKCHFAIMRAGWGDSGIDAKIDIYRNGIAATPMVYGLYWYCKPGLNYKTHVASFKQKWLEGPGVLPPVMDLEYTTLNMADTTTWVQNLLSEWAFQTGVAAMVYTSPGWWNDHILASYNCPNPLWEAHWTTAATPILPHGWGDYLFWQWSADNNGKGYEYGSLDGDADMDLDRFHGTLAEFNAKFNTNLQPLNPSNPTVTPIEPIKYVYINTSSLNIRASNTVDSTDVGTLKFNDDVPVLEVNNGWYRIGGWIKASYCRTK